MSQRVYGVSATASRPKAAFRRGERHPDCGALEATGRGVDSRGTRRSRAWSSAPRPHHGRGPDSERLPASAGSQDSERRDTSSGKLRGKSTRDWGGYFGMAKAPRTHVLLLFLIFRCTHVNHILLNRTQRDKLLV